VRAIAIVTVSALLATPAARAAEAPADDQTIGFDDFSGVDGNGNVVRASAPYLGKDHIPLDGVDFYEQLGREDLVDAYESREHAKTALYVAGGLVFLGSLAGSIYAAVQGGSCDLESNCLGSSIGWSVGLGTVGTLLGTGLFLGGAAMDPNPVSNAQRHQLAREYNAGLAGNGLELRF
jgi:hypothetical protein